MLLTNSLKIGHDNILIDTSNHTVKEITPLAPTTKYAQLLLMRSKLIIHS